MTGAQALASSVLVGFAGGDFFVAVDKNIQLSAIFVHVFVAISKKI